MIVRLSATTLLLLTGYVSAQSPPLTYTLLLENLQEPQGVVAGIGGVLYGTTGLATNQVYSLAPPASPGAPWTYTVLYTFNGGADGSAPYPGLATGRDGVLYGTTQQGGCSGRGDNCGVVYSLTPPATSDGAWSEEILYQFSADASPGIVLGAEGVLYGSSGFGGASNDGAIFSLTPPSSPGAPWTYTLLYSFTGGSDGHGPAGLVLSKRGVLFGTTTMGGTGHGTLFVLKPPAAPGDSWTKEILYKFAGGSNGVDPAGLVIGKDGALYSTMTQGGNSSCSSDFVSGCGTVFAVTPPDSPGSPWVFNTLHSFTGGDDGWNPSGVVMGSDGRLFGTCAQGGPATYYGALFVLTPPESAGGSWTETTLWGFANNVDGTTPNGVVFGLDGALYGTVADGAGCPAFCGGVFSFTL